MRRLGPKPIEKPERVSGDLFRPALGNVVRGIVGPWKDEVHNPGRYLILVDPAPVRVIVNSESAGNHHRTFAEEKGRAAISVKHGQDFAGLVNYDPEIA